MPIILVTGCSGYIGQKLIPFLKKGAYTVYGIDRNSCLKSVDRFWQHDLLETTMLEHILSEVSTVIHLAAAKADWGMTEQEFFRDNVEATHQLLRTGRKKGIKNWIFYSSVATLGPSKVPLNEQAEYAPITPYGRSKVEAEKLFHQFAYDDPEARIVIIRPSAVFGPGNPPDTNIHRLMDAIHNNRFIMIGRGKEIKTTSYHDNLISATLFLLQRMQRGVQTYVYVDEPRLSTAELVRLIYGMLHKPKPQWWVPLLVAMPIACFSDLTAEIFQKDFPITAARIKKFCTSTNYDATAIRKLGFQQPVPIEKALLHTLQWYLQAQRYQTTETIHHGNNQSLP